MAHLPCLRACGRAAIVGACHFGRMLRMDAREHLLLAEILVVVLLGLWIESGIVIGIVALRTGRRGENRLVQTADAAAARLPIPAIVAALRIGVTVADDSGSARILRRQHRV